MNAKKDEAGKLEKQDKLPEKYEATLGSIGKLTPGFIARAMVLASMPHSKPKETRFERKNGKYTLSMQSDEKIGLPYGPIPRLLFAWITTEAVKTKQRTLVLGKNLSDFMRKLDLEPTGGKRGYITALQEQLRRLFTSTIRCIYSDNEQEAGIQMLLADNYDLWWTPKNPKQIGLMDSTITLSEKFFNEVTQSPVVFYMEALKILRKSPMALDIYMWLTYKNSYSREMTVILWESLQMQFGAGYPDDARGKADFKRKFKKALGKVGTIYEAANKLKALPKGLLYVPGDPHVPKSS
jgi:hypothetical protein